MSDKCPYYNDQNFTHIPNREIFVNEPDVVGNRSVRPFRLPVTTQNLECVST